jgi:rfaE bifunctional protein nucleotidyltransferase chain/domain
MAILSLEEAISLRAEWRRLGRRLVVTNGCFDLLHAGHAAYLTEARALGDLLLVGLNDDASVTRLKGPGRPLAPLADRTTLLAALRPVDHVVPFAEDTAEDLLRALTPDIYVKGGDYGPAHEPPEAAVARALGARVYYLPFHEGRSTSALIQIILDRFRESRST